MEFMEGGTLTESCKKHNFEEDEIAYVSKHMLLALIFMHKNSITHRDLKSANVMMTIEGDIKLIDLGLCAILEGGYKVGMVGSPFWMAPEMIRREPYDNKIDIWSFAICLLELANRHPPNDSNIIRAMFTTAVEGCPSAV